MKQVPVAYQIYSAREDAQKDLASVLKSLKEMGYDGVEFAGFYGHSAEEVKKMLDDNGLVAVSSHVPVANIEADMFGTIAYHQAIGCKYIAIPYLDDAHRPGAAGFPEMIKLIWQFGRLCKEAGITLLYHNHDFEFLQLSGVYGLDFLYSAVCSCVLKTEIDTCWVKYAGEDPAAYLRKYTGRAPIVHLKDFVGEKTANMYALIGIDEKEEKKTAFEFRPVGFGRQDMPAIVMVGDTAFDVIGAAAHGIPTIGVSWGYGEVEDMEKAGAKAIAHSMDELFALLNA